MADERSGGAGGQDGRTPLHMARDEAVARLLVERGADVNARNNVRRHEL